MFEIMKFLGGLVGIVLLRILGYTMLGVLINILLIVINWETVWQAISNMPEFSTEFTRGYFFLASAVIFPVLFFLLGQKQGMQKALSIMLDEKKDDLIRWLFEKLYEKKPEIFESNDHSNERMVAIVNDVAGYIDKIPKIVVSVIVNFVSVIDLGGKLVSIVKTAKYEKLSGQEKVCSIADEVSRLIPKDLLQPSIKLPFVLLSINMLSFIG